MERYDGEIYNFISFEDFLSVNRKVCSFLFEIEEVLKEGNFNKDKVKELINGCEGHTNLLEEEYRNAVNNIYAQMKRKEEN